MNQNFQNIRTHNELGKLSKEAAMATRYYISDWSKKIIIIKKSHPRQPVFWLCFRPQTFSLRNQSSKYLTTVNNVSIIQNHHYAYDLIVALFSFFLGVRDEILHPYKTSYKILLHSSLQVLIAGACSVASVFRSGPHWMPTVFNFSKPWNCHL